MRRQLRHRPLSHKIISGIIAGIIVGLLLGFVIAFRLTQINDSLHTPFLRGQLHLHMAAIYGIFLIIPGLIIGILALGRRREVGLVAHGIIILCALIIFYYGRNWLSYHIWARFGGWRWLLEVVGFLGWMVLSWAIYRIIMYLEENARGWTVRLAFILLIILVIRSAYPVIKVPPENPNQTTELALPAPKENVKVALIGVDGAWWDIIDPMLEKGEMPVFQSLIDRGVRSPCHTLLPTLSAPIWTTIATGKNPDKHHITAFTVWTFPITHVVLPLTRYPVICYELEWMIGRVIRWTPMNSTFRMSEAVWNILSDAGLTVGVMNWWASYPAEPINGFVVTDHALYDKTLKYILRDESSGDPRSVFPPQLLPELEPLVLDPMRIPLDSVARFINFETDADRLWYQNTQDYRVYKEESTAAMFKFSYPEDETMVRAALHMLRTHGQPDFFAVYLDGLDSMQHKYLPYFFHDRHTDVLTPENINRLKDLVPNYYRYVDEFVGRIMSALDPNTIVVIVSDHGFNYGMEPNGNYNHPNAPPGVFLIAGGDIKHGKTITTASVPDVTPTILTLFGLPVGDDMDGKVLTGAFEMENVPVSHIDTYDIKNRQRGRVEPSQMDEAIQERLRALGYTK